MRIDQPPLAEAFYQSENLWPAAGVIVAALAIPFTVWATLRAARPKRILRCDFVAPVSLVNATSSNLTITFDGTPLARPHIAGFRLINRGRDIPSAAFDGNRPIELDLGVTIIAALSPEPLPPNVQFHGTKLLLHPRLIKSGDKEEYKLLTEGRCRDFSTNFPLIDTKISMGGDMTDEWHRLNPPIP
mgnify:CR=1 FL=1